MKLWQLANRNLAQRALASSLTTLSIALGTAIVAFLWLVAGQTEKRYAASSQGYNVIVGPRESSPLELVLSAVYMIRPSRGVVPLRVYQELHDEARWKQHVRCAVPFAFGDSYRGFPIVATTEEWFTVFGAMTQGENRPPRLELAAGRPFRFSHDDLLAEAKLQAHLKSGDHAGHDHGKDHEIPEAWKEVVVGATVARTLRLSIGSIVVPAHGVGQTLHEHEEAACKVAGILAPLGTPIDRAVYLPLGAFYRMQEHSAIGAEKPATSAEDVEISAIVLNTRPPVGFQKVRHEFQRRADALVSIPSQEIAGLFEVVGNVALALRVLSFVVLVVAALGVFISLYNTMNERRRDVAIMRSLGARRVQILSIVLLEAVLIAGAGATAGVAVAHAVAAGLGDWLLARTGVQVSGAAFGIEELWLILGVLGLGAIAGLLPAVQASQTDVARYLTPDR